MKSTLTIDHGYISSGKSLRSNNNESHSLKPVTCTKILIRDLHFKHLSLVLFSPKHMLEVRKVEDKHMLGFLGSLKHYLGNLQVETDLSLH